MTLESIRTLFLWSALMNYGIVLLWFSMFMMAHDWMYQMHGRWFRISREQFDAVHYAVMAIYKVGILLFNVVPYVALLIIT